MNLAKKYDLTHVGMVGPDGNVVFLIPSESPSPELNDRRKKERGAILGALNLFDELVSRLEVANDWLADKGVPANHVEMKRIREAIANAKAVQP